MFQGKRFLGIIPARKGSKRLPNKNLLTLKDRPLISWTIESALHSNNLDSVILSSDSEKILSLGENYGIEFPLIRPDYLSEDDSVREDVIRHAINFLKEEDCQNYDYFVYLQPTSPLRTSLHIDAAIEFTIDSNAKSVFSVCEIDHPIEWSSYISENKSMESFNVENLIKQSQEFKKRFRLNGAIYICNIENFLQCSSMFFGKDSYAFEMDKFSSIDIDDKYDFMIAESFMENIKNDC